MPADEHVLVFDSGKLRYESSPAQYAPGKTHGAQNQPDLIIQDVRSAGDELEIEFGLLPKADQAEDLSPVSVRFSAYSESGLEREWRLNRLPPNVANQHFPCWRVSLGGWPAGARRIELQVMWQDQPAESCLVPLDWNQRFAEKVFGEQLNMKLIKREQKPVRSSDGISQVQVLLTFALTERGPGIAEWGIITPPSVLDAKQAYGGTHGVYTVQLLLPEDTVLNDVTLFRAGPPVPDRTLKVSLTLAENRINP
jgi:hypothetical protein